MGGQESGTSLHEFGLKCMDRGNTGVQWGGWFNKEINSGDDLKGLKMRIPGLGIAQGKRAHDHGHFCASRL